MNHEHDPFTHVIEAWLDADPGHEDPAEVFDRVIARLDATPQRRFAWPAWKLSTVNNFLRLATAAALIGVALVSYQLLMGSNVAGPAPSPAETGSFVEPFIGLPPEGARPSTPENGQLVLRVYGRMNITEDVHGIWVYADGRLIWRRSLDSHITPEARRHGFGASEPTRAVIEQRLRPEGVELLRSEVIRAGLAGLVEPDSECGGPPYWPPYWAQLAVRVGDQLMSGEWCAPGLAGHLADFASWLPASAWAEQRIGAYVPLWYAVCIAPSEEQAQVVDQLPGSIRRLLRSYAPPRIWPDGNPDACSYQVTTDEARAIAAMLDDAGLERSFFDSHRSRLGYTFPLDQGAIDGWSGDGWFLLVPMLPNGEPVEYDQ